MRRREFIAGLSGAAMWPLMASAQQPKRLIVGYFGATTAAAEKLRTDAFVRRLGELGWIDGETVAIDYRWARRSVMSAFEGKADVSGFSFL
jgi:putative tryptophan/tyrosine transport system substrate-binding protein